MPDCSFVKETNSIKAGEEEFKKEPSAPADSDDVIYSASYTSITFEGPATLDVEPTDTHQCWYLGWYHLGKWHNIRATKSADKERWWHCPWNEKTSDEPTYYWYQERERGYGSWNAN